MDNIIIDKEPVKTQSQLEILNEINKICSRLNHNIWLRGGWAIDFILGRITRPHSDIDLVTWIQYREELEQALVDADFNKMPVSEFQTDFLKKGVDISFVYVKRLDNGSIVANGFPDWVWRNNSLPMKYYNLEGISMSVLNPYQLLEEKMVYEQGTGRKLRSKDIESVKIIQKIIEELC